MEFLQNIDIMQLVTPAGFIGFLLYNHFTERNYLRELLDKRTSERNEAQNKRIEDQQAHNRELMEAIRKLDEIARAYRGTP